MPDDTTDDTTTAVATADGNVDPQPASTPEDKAPEDGVSNATLDEGAGQEATPDDDSETFPREYVEQLRNENARYRQRAQQADTYAQRLHTELVRATGRLADPTDLPFNEDHLADADNMAAAIDELLTAKPHLASRRPTGDIGQGPLSVGPANVDLAAILRGRAG